MLPFQAHFYDGLTAGRHDVHVALNADRVHLDISGDTLSPALHWPLQDLRALKGSADRGGLTLTRVAETDDEAPRDPARLVITDPGAIDWFHKTRPSLFKTDLRSGTFRKIATYAGAAVVAVLMMLFVILPALANSLAKILPIEREIAFGRHVTAQMERFMGASELGALRCSSPEGDAAIAKMLTRLTENHDMHYDVEIHVFDHPMLNAFAAPGGQVVMMRGLIEEAERAEEVAGVLAHEIAHVENRDATRHALRATGSAGLLTMLIGDFTGAAAIALIGEHMLSASYTREAEGIADEFALEMLANADVDSNGFARFFDELGEHTHGVEIPSYLSTHPATGDRADKARAFAAQQSDTRPILNEMEWQAMRSICDKSD